MEGLNQVTILTANQNRFQELNASLESWQLLDGVAEILIVDWSSDRPIVEEIDWDRWRKGPKLRVVRVEGEQRWSITRALNHGLGFVETPSILKLDAEVDVNPDLLTKNPLEKHVFYTGNWKTAFPWNKHINGSCLGWTTDFEAVGGWDARIEGYGWDDSDLYLRLESSGLFRQDFAPGTLRHRKQSDASRINTRGRHEALSPGLATRANKYVAFADTPWSKSLADRFSKGADVASTVYRKNLVIDSVARATATKQTPSRLRHFVAGIYWGWRFRVMSWLMNRGLKFRKPVLYIEANFGLGNRLRVVFSGLLMAKAMRRQPVVVWIPDSHCEARLNELFTYRGPVIEKVEDVVPIVQRRSIRVLNYMETGFAPQKGRKISRLPRMKDVYIRAFSTLRHDAVSHSEMNWLARSWTPVDEVAGEINKLFPCDVGVHCRSEVPTLLSASYDQSAGNWSEGGQRKLIESRLLTGPEVFVGSIADNFGGQQQASKLAIHVASDLQSSKEYISTSLRGRFAVVRTIPSLSGRSERAVRQALAEAYALAASDVFIGSRYSSFSELVLLLRDPLKKHELLPNG